MNHWEFCECSYGLLHYDPKNKRYPGDYLFIIARQKNKWKPKRAINFPSVLLWLMEIIHPWSNLLILI